MSVHASPRRLTGLKDTVILLKMSKVAISTGSYDARYGCGA